MRLLSATLLIRPWLGEDSGHVGWSSGEHEVFMASRLLSFFGGLLD